MSAIQNQLRSGRRATAGGSTPTRPQSMSITRGRSSVFQRVGANVSFEPPSTPPQTATPSLGSSAVPSSSPEPEESPQAPPPLQEEPSGLTPASLKHLKRQRDALAEEKIRLQAELEELRKQLKQFKEQVKVLEADLAESQKEAAEAKEKAEAEKERADMAEVINIKLEETLAQKEAEIERLRKALEDQRQLTQEVCEAAERRADKSSESNSRVKELEEELQKLRQENAKLHEDMKAQMRQHEEMGRNVAVAMAAAEKAMAMHAHHNNQVESLRTAKLAEAINQKVELHISVPRVTLSYNNAPPLTVSLATGLGEVKIRSFLDTEVFPHFEPLWVRMDGLDKAPDGSSKRAYATKMLDRLTAAVKAFVMKSQDSEGSEGFESLKAADNDSRESGSRGSKKEISDGDRAKLMQALREGDDKSLDDKLQEMLKSRGL
mmetsp:Transcript_32395/g.58889  ORF Transcript_32395/g.58889 Transcript_32395/m.58889 type:complete len:435 (-) Transcript_32395:20-1324(-)